MFYTAIMIVPMSLQAGLPFPGEETQLIWNFYFHQ